MKLGSFFFTSFLSSLIAGLKYEIGLPKHPNQSSGVECNFVGDVGLIHRLSDFVFNYKLYITHHNLIVKCKYKPLFYHFADGVNILLQINVYIFYRNNHLADQR